VNEALTITVHSLAFAEDDLQDALEAATEVEAMIMLPLIKRLSDIRNEIVGFAKARNTCPGGSSGM
jgi:hypothetical protein